MDEHCGFIWQIIDHTPVLRKEIQSLESVVFNNPDKQIAEIVEFFREIDLMVEEVIDTYNYP